MSLYDIFLMVSFPRLSGIMWYGVEAPGQSENANENTFDHQRVESSQLAGALVFDQNVVSFGTKRHTAPLSI